VTAVEDCEYTVTLLRMTLRIGHRGFQPALVKIVTLLYFMFLVAFELGARSTKVNNIENVNYRAAYRGSVAVDKLASLDSRVTLITYHPLQTCIRRRHFLSKAFIIPVIASCTLFCTASIIFSY